MAQKLAYKNVHFKVSGIDEENHIIRGVFSTGAEDRQGEIVDQNGWKLDEFLANPVILFAHDHYQPAVAKCIELVKDAAGNLAGAIQFAYDEYDFAATLFKLYAGGYMRAFSVGFMNDIIEFDQENDTVTLKENTLYEISCVNVPANAMALAFAKGIDIAPVERIMQKKVAETPTAEKALELISKSNIDTIKSAIGTLQRVVEAAEPPARGGEVEHPARAGGAKRIPVSLLNKAVRDLLAVKKISK